MAVMTKRAHILNIAKRVLLWSLVGIGVAVLLFLILVFLTVSIVGLSPSNFWLLT